MNMQYVLMHVLHIVFQLYSYMHNYHVHKHMNTNTFVFQSLHIWALHITIPSVVSILYNTHRQVHNNIQVFIPYSNLPITLQ